MTDFVLAGDMVIAEYVNGQLARRYLPGPGVDQRVAVIHCDTSTTCQAPDYANFRAHFYLPDRQGNVLATVGPFGDVQEQYHYTPFGVEMVGDPTGNPFRYTGRYFDAETGLYYYRARYYDADLGRFLSVDPIGYADQLNLYAYVGNNPLNATDPTGEACHPVNVAGQFCRNATRYTRYDSNRTVRAQTNFFKAAASVSDSFGSFDLGFGLPRVFTSQNTRHHMRQINARLARVNERAYEQFRNGTWQDRGSVEANDNAMVHIEQSEIQSYLGDLAETNIDQYTDLVSNMNEILNNGAGGLEFLDPDVALAGQRVREQLGRDIDFANQDDREAIGRELVRYYRELRE